ncbi:MAG: RNA pyrophosphohydrolase [Rhodospirillaceae bacterium]|nr:RNA pyrophosphohydrolase [Rhodospirillaceae bacterium]
MKSKPYRRGVGIALIDARGYVFVGRRSDTKSAWQMPQGGIDKDETPRQAALRELKEETGTDQARIIGVTRSWLRYDLPADLRARVWKGKYRGQEQKWFLMRFTGRDQDIDLAAHTPEFETWKWLPFRQLPRVIVGFKREIYKQIVAYFGDKVAALSTPGTKRARLKRSRPKRPALKRELGAKRQRRRTSR